MLFGRLNIYIMYTYYHFVLNTFDERTQIMFFIIFECVGLSNCKSWQIPNTTGRYPTIAYSIKETRTTFDLYTTNFDLRTQPWRLGRESPDLKDSSSSSVNADKSLQGKRGGGEKSIRDGANAVPLPKITCPRYSYLEYSQGSTVPVCNGTVSS